MQKQKRGVLLNDYRIFEAEEFIKKLSKLNPIYSHHKCILPDDQIVVHICIGSPTVPGGEP